ncbi:MAG: ABC transporter permease [Nitrospinae bacterium]|nr:ABC transporter permease [Nitrospinota bacterium]
MSQNNFVTSLPETFNCLKRNRDLLLRLTKRDIIGRYSGSFIGIFWSLINPLFMLIVYTFVFSVVFKMKWGIGGESKTEFALLLFSGLIVHSLFAECINRAPSTILANVNYVKKVIFPLEILPWINMGTALFHSLASFCILLIFYLFIHFSFNVTVFLLPFVLLPLVFITMGISWFLASLGVYVRDVGQVTPTISVTLLFVSPVFYPISSLPEKYQIFLYLNPLTFIIEQVRGILLLGNMPNWTGLLIYFVVSIIIAWLGLFWFQKTRKGFADVL